MNLYLIISKDGLGKAQTKVEANNVLSALLCFVFEFPTEKVLLIRKVE